MDKISGVSEDVLLVKILSFLPTKADVIKHKCFVEAMEESLEASGKT